MTKTIHHSLCVDLDGTLIATDTLWESVLLLLREHFLLIFKLPFWLLQGRAYLKHQIAQYVTLDVATLPYNKNLLRFLQDEKNKGRMLVLATAAHQSIAQAVADHLKLFDVIIASDAQINMKGATKRDALKERFKTYDYIGDSRADLPILHDAHEGFLVAPRSALQKQFTCPSERIFSTPKTTLWDWLKALRPHQWVKNGLIFLPLILAHQFDLSQLGVSLLAFITFSLIASSGYILNDLLDLAADRIHPTKKERPFASGRIPIQYGLPLFALLVCFSFSLSLLWLPIQFTAILGLYFSMSIAYSFYFKQKLIVDILVLAGLYTLRILAGGLAISIPISPWLLAFSMFIFTSLAFLKRYVELMLLIDKEEVLKRRSYEKGDLEMIASMGPTSGYIAILVFALYLNSEKVSTLYMSPFILWLICPILLYWITRVWFLARRQKMLDDPVLFALKDKTSWLVVACIFVLMLIAQIDLFPKFW